jgi:hypothetical protein
MTGQSTTLIYYKQRDINTSAVRARDSCVAQIVILKWKTVLKDGSQYTGVLKQRSTRVSIIGGKWFLNETVTYGGANAEGLLMNGRMVNSAFEDTNRKDFDPEANTDRFIAHIPDYLSMESAPSR